MPTVAAYKAPFRSLSENRWHAGQEAFWPGFTVDFVTVKRLVTGWTDQYGAGPGAAGLSPSGAVATKPGLRYQFAGGRRRNPGYVPVDCYALPSGRL